MSKNGPRPGAQSWVCRECKKTRTTPLQKKNSDVDARIANLVVKGETVDAIAKELKLRPTQVTVRMKQIAAVAKQQKSDRWPGSGKVALEIATIGTLGFALVGKGRKGFRLVDFDVSDAALCKRRSLRIPPPVHKGWLDTALGLPSTQSWEDIETRLFVVLARTNGWRLSD